VTPGGRQPRKAPVPTLALHLAWRRQSPPHLPWSHLSVSVSSLCLASGGSSAPVPCLLLIRFHVSLMAMLDWSSCPAVERVPGKVSGAWVFRGTRVPVQALFENLEDGACIDDFLSWFPGVTRQQVEAVLEHAQRSLQ